MAPSLAISLDALGGWRAGLARRLDELTRYLAERDLMRGATAPQLASMRERLTNEKLVLAFVAEFSRGKSELINAIFFADTGRRILPATPGRTTMCPVELGWDAGEPAALSLLPIETRLEGVPLGDLKQQPRAWRRFPLDLDDVGQARRSRCRKSRGPNGSSASGRGRSASGTTSVPTTTRRPVQTAGSRFRPGAMR